MNITKPLEQFVCVREMAKGLGIHQTHVSRYALKNGFALSKRRSVRGQTTMALSQSDFEKLKALRIAQGFSVNGESKAVSAAVLNGVFYAIQLVPDLSTQRIKLGFTDSIKDRLNTHRITCPTAKVLATWPCVRTWELAAIDCITKNGCRAISNEIFDFDDLDQLKQRADAFFQLMPAVK